MLTGSPVVLKPEYHEGYITPDEFEQNQARLARNRTKGEGTVLSGPAREGLALLQGCWFAADVRERSLCGTRVTAASTRSTCTVGNAGWGLATTDCMSARSDLLDDAISEAMLPIRRKNVEPLAAHQEPERVSARHQSLHYFVSKSEWSDAALLEQVRRWVLPHMNPESGLYWIIDDTSFPKKGNIPLG